MSPSTSELKSSIHLPFGSIFVYSRQNIRKVLPLMDDTDKIGSDVVSTNGRFNNIWLSSLRGLDNRELSHFFSVN